MQGQNEIGRKVRSFYIDSKEQDRKFVSNSIKTARYNIVTFLPLAIIYQFMNYFNIFFLFSSVILSISVISPIDPVSAVTPFLFVLIISIVREALEDLKKAKFDKLYNRSLSLQYDKESGNFEEIQWKDISIGRILKVMKNEVIPADLLVMKSSLENGFCYLQTTNLDGETALKPREALLLFQDVVNCEKDLAKLKGSVQVDPPDENIYSVEGRVQLEGYQDCYFDINNVILRGGTLKNVEYVWGLVIYTGKETKIMKNIKHGSFKLSSIESQMNKIVIYIIILTFAICLICTMFGVTFQNTNKGNMSYIYYSRGDKDDYTLQLFQTFASFFTIFNTLIPISVIITMEVVKALQVINLEKDPLLRELPEEKVRMFSMKLHEDLGNVKYIFTDKTGTLTKNEMTFKACSIFTKLFDEERSDSSVSISSYQSNDFKSKSIIAENFDARLLRQTLVLEQPIDIVDCNTSPFMSMKDAALEFFFNIAINHNVLTEIDPKTGEKYYSGSSPDEVVLVQAAKELGVEFIERSNKTIRIKVFDKEYTFTVLHRFEYSASRMRSSIIVMDKNNVIKLYMKGADSVILKKINQYSQEFLHDPTKAHVDKFAKIGLRTLCFSMKVLDEEVLSEWENGYKILQDKALKDKSFISSLDLKIGELEDDMLLIGVSALEDKLQDDVKVVLQDFIEAGINVWMLTGDKLDTAESIGYSCKLFNDDTYVFKIKSGKKNYETLEIVKGILDRMNSIENELIDFKIERRRKKREGENFRPIKKPEALFINKNREDEIDRLEEVNIFESESIGKMKRNRMNSINNNFVPRLGSPRMKKAGSPDFTRRGSGSITLSKGMNLLSKNVFNEKGNAIDLNQMNDQIINENMKYIGSNLDKKSNLITLNFIRPTNNANHIPPISPKGKVRPFSSSNANHKFNFKMNKEQDKNINSKNMKQQELSAAGDESNEMDDVDIIKFMVDAHFFEENVKENGNSFLKKIAKEENDTFNMKHAQNFQTKDNHRNHNNDFNFFSENANIIRPVKKRESDERDVHNNFLLNELEENSNKQLLKERTKENASDNIDFSNLYETYKKQLKSYQPNKNYKFFDFNFDDADTNQDITMKNFGMIIEGDAISQCLTEDIAPLFWECLKKSRSIICCRCSPIQKSEVVCFVKNKSGQITLSIGDGGNDVNMIKMANVGVGIFGKEGYQAAYNSDYAISQFKYLKRLLFVHGRFSLLRNSYFVIFFFYKNLIFTFPQFWSAFFSAFSGTLFWDDWFYLGYNSFFTTIPAAIRMMYEEDIDITFEDYPDRKLFEYLVPDLYKEYRNSRPFNIPKFFFVFIGGVIHSAIIYFLPFYFLKFGILDYSGRSVSMWNISALSSFSIIAIQYYLIFEDSLFLNKVGVIAHSIQFLIYLIFILVHQARNIGQLSGELFDIMSNIQFWFELVITVFVCLLPVIVVRRAQCLFEKTIVNNLRHKKYQYDLDRKNIQRKVSEMQKCTRSVAKFKRIYKLNTDFEPENLAEKKIKDIVDNYKNEKNKKSIRNRRAIEGSNNGNSNSDYQELSVFPSKVQRVGNPLNINLNVNNNLNGQSALSPQILKVKNNNRIDINQNFEIENIKLNETVPLQNEDKPEEKDDESDKKQSTSPMNQKTKYNQFFALPIEEESKIQESRTIMSLDGTKIEQSKVFKQSELPTNPGNETKKEKDRDNDPLIHDYPLEISNMFQEEDSKGASMLKDY